MIPEFPDKSSLIAFLVEKSTKGIKKQLRGYVQQIQEQIEYYKRHVDSRIKDFENLIKINVDMRKDWAAVEMMLRENEQNKKLVFEMRSLHQEIRNELMDIKLLNKELQQKLKGSF